MEGRKRTEWRWRKRPDPMLEAVQIGEPIALLECGSNRIIRATVRAKIRFDYRVGHCLYAIRLLNPRLVRPRQIRKLQGWHRRRSLAF